MFIFLILNSSVFEKDLNNGKVQKKHTGTSEVQHNNSTYSEKEFYHNDSRDLCFLILVVVYPSSDNGSSANNSEALLPSKLLDRTGSGASSVVKPLVSSFSSNRPRHSSRCTMYRYSSVLWCVTQPSLCPHVQLSRVSDPRFLVLVSAT